MRILAVAGPLALLGLASCTAGPDTYAAMTTGVGFGDYQRYIASREAPQGARGAPYSVPPQGAAPLLPPASMPASAPSTLDAVPLRPLPVTAQPLPATAPAPQPSVAPMITLAPPAPMAIPSQPAPQTAPIQTAPIQTTAARPVTVQAGASFGTTPAFDAGPSVRPGVSDEQDFTAVAARESIESDRDRLARQRAQYQIIEVTSVPPPSAHAGPNIVAYALATTHAPGTQMHRRMNPMRWSRWENACLQYRTQEAAQEAFLSNGGPERDRDNLDPDGDGYACWWDPSPLRQALASR